MTNPDLSQPTLSIVIPALNEARRLAPALLQIRQYAERTGLRAEVIVVDDGSTDGTSEVARAFEPGPLSVVVLRNLANRGKGYSVRRGMRRARGEFLLMTDADQSTPIWQIEKALPFLIAGFDVVIGSRDLEDSQVTKEQTWQRHFMGRVMRFLRKRMMLADINDTQCGFKAFSQEAGKRIFAALRDKGFAFDCEVLLLARRMGYRIKETGVIWCNDTDSRVRPFRDPLRMIVSLVRIRWRLRGGRPPAPPKP
jgi:dolichyl-phosphate beta-glucosyltransferase